MVSDEVVRRRKSGGCGEAHLGMEMGKTEETTWLVKTGRAVWRKEIGGGELEMAAVLRCREEGARGARAGKEARQGSSTPFIERGMAVPANLEALCETIN